MRTGTIKHYNTRYSIVTIGDLYRCITGLMCQASTKSKPPITDFVKELEKLPIAIAVEGKESPVKRLRFNGNNLVLEDV